MTPKEMDSTNSLTKKVIQNLIDFQKENNDINNNSLNTNLYLQENNFNENDFVIEENNINEKYDSYNEKVNYKFQKNPKYLKYKLDVTYTNTNWGANDIFEVFLSCKDNKEYIISPNYINNNLDIYSLKKIKLITSLEGHKNRITVIRYFINKKNNKEEYLASADYNKIIIIWDIIQNYKIKYKINTQYGTSIYSCLLIFPNYICENYIISST